MKLVFPFLHSSVTICSLVLTSFFVSLAGTGKTGNQRSDENFLLQTADGKEYTAPLSKIASDWSVRLGGEKPALVSGKDVVSLQRVGVERPPHPLAAHLVFSNGDRLLLDLKSGIRLEQERIHATPAAPVRPGQGAELKLPFIFVEMIWLRAPEKTLQPAKFLRRFLRTPRDTDVLLLRNGDRMEGTLLSVDSRTVCKIKLAGKLLEVPFTRIAALAFKSESMIRPPKQAAFGHVVLANGSRLSLLSAETDAAQKNLVGKSLHHFPLQIPLDQLVALDVRLERAVYLSDLEPAKYEHENFFGVAWPFATDAGVAGLPLQLREVGTFDKGLGLHNGSRITYRLDGKYLWFEAWVGLDPRSAIKGSARIKVLADDKVVFDTKKELTAGDPPQKIRVEVKDSQSLTLHVDYGSRGNVQGHVNWCQARLLK